MIAGVDVGQRRDHTGIVIIDPATVTISGVHQLRLGQDWKAIVGGIAGLIHQCDRVTVDATGMGGPIAEALDDRIPGEVVPFLFTAKSKQELMLLLVQAIRGGRLRIAPDCPGADVLKDELKRLVVTPTRTGFKVSGKGTGHDDLAMAAALALYGMVGAKA